jgi:copper chaperone CopZ
MSTSTNPDRLADARSVELVIGGMTCASCAARIEKKLNKLEGVSATVNYATEKAKVTYAGSVTTEDLVTTVGATGYTAAIPAAKAAGALFFGGAGMAGMQMSVGLHTSYDGGTDIYLEAASVVTVLILAG